MHSGEKKVPVAREVLAISFRLLAQEQIDDVLELARKTDFESFLMLAEIALEVGKRVQFK